jgi:hypothetical protein
MCTPTDVTPLTLQTTVPLITDLAPGVGRVLVTWQPPTLIPPSPITAYVVTAYVGFVPVVSVIAGPASTQRWVPGLTTGVSYRFRVRPHTADGGALGFSKAAGLIQTVVPVGIG